MCRSRGERIKSHSRNKPVLTCPLFEILKQNVSFFPLIRFCGQCFELLQDISAFRLELGGGQAGAGQCQPGGPQIVLGRHGTGGQ